jgi:flagellar hook-length control protein FliK
MAASGTPQASGDDAGSADDASGKSATATATGGRGRGRAATGHVAGDGGPEGGRSVHRGAHSDGGQGAASPDGGFPNGSSNNGTGSGNGQDAQAGASTSASKEEDRRDLSAVAGAADRAGQGDVGLASGAAAGGNGAATATPDGSGFAAQLLAARAEPGARAGEVSTEPPRTTAHAVLQADDPGFPGQVALKVAEWSASGVQQATLDLHPAELGPIQIHIDLDGQNASVRFGAAHERTRALLDDALPALALALQSDGLSLAASQVTDVVKPAEQGAGLSDGRGAFGASGGDLSGASGDAGSGQGRGQAPPPPLSDVGLSTSSGRSGAVAWQSLPRSGVGAAPAAAAHSDGRLRLDLYA